MHKKNLIAGAIVALLFGAIGAYVGQRRPAPAPGPAQALFAQTLPDPAGAPHALAQWQGKALLVNFWAPWCAPCVQEMPELSALQAEFGPARLQVIGIGVDTPANIAAFTRKVQVGYPLYVAGGGAAALARRFGNTAGGLPYTVLIGADGQPRKTYLGRLDFARLRADLGAL